MAKGEARNLIVKLDSLATNNVLHYDGTDFTNTSSLILADLTLSAPLNIYALSHDSFADFAANEHFTQANITTVGTIGTGIWQGTSISTTYTDAKCTATWPNTYTADQNLQQADSPAFTGLTLSGNLTFADPGTNANSYKISLIADSGGTNQTSEIYTAYGADPYLRLSVPNDAGAATAVLDIHDQVIAFSTDNTTDIGASGANRPKNYYGSGLITIAGALTASNYTAANLLTACATNAGALDFSAASKTLTVEDNAVVSQDYSTDATPTFGNLLVGTNIGGATNGSMLDVSGANLKINYAIYLNEVAAAYADSAGFGQVWVKNTTPNQLWFTDDAGTDKRIDTGQVVQVVNTQTGATATLSTVIPADDTIPQNDEGVEIMTLAITPTSATNKLKIETIVHLSGSELGWLIAALFQDTTANALAAGLVVTEVANYLENIKFTHYMTTGTTSETTFKVRAGIDSGSAYFNGISTGRYLGGVIASSITITEIEV